MIEISQDKIALSKLRQDIFTQIVNSKDLIENLHNLVWEHAILTTEIVKQKKANPKWQNNKPINKNIFKVLQQEAFRICQAKKTGAIVCKLSLNKTIQQCAIECCKMTIANEEQEWIWQRKLWPFLTSQALAKLKLSAKNEAIGQFKNYLRSLLQVPVHKAQITMGVKASFYQGIRVVIVDYGGKLIDYSIIYPFAPVLAREEGIKELAKLIIKYNVSVIGIGAGGIVMRDTKQLFDIIKQRYPDLTYQVQKVDSVGAEGCIDLSLPELDAEYHACLSIARRLQDPELEIAKIDPCVLGEKFFFDTNKECLNKEVTAIIQNYCKKKNHIHKQRVPKNTTMADAFLKWKANSAK